MNDLGIHFRVMLAPIDGTEVPLIGMRPEFHADQLDDAPKLEDPVVRSLVQLGWSRQIELAGILPKPHRDFTVSLSADRRYRVGWRGLPFKQGATREPQQWIDAVHRDRRAVMVYHPVRGDEVNCEELYTAMEEKRCLLLAVPLLEAAFGA